jgi:hypothetical protein
MGEKISTEEDYYMEVGDFNRIVERYRHGTVLGSNYLFLDMHVDTETPVQAYDALDPWDFAGGPPPNPPAPSPGLDNQ